MDYTSLNNDISFLTGQSTNTYLPVDRLNNINNWYRNTYAEILKYQSRNWENDDSNYADFPIATQTTVIGQKDYALPSDFLKLLRLEAKDTNGISRKLKEFSEEEIDTALTEYYKTPGTPVAYKELYNAIELYPAFSTVITDGLTLYYIRDISEFQLGDTDKKPGIPETFHRLLSLGASYDWFMAKGGDTTKIEKMIADKKVELAEFYAQKNKEVRLKLIASRRYNYE